MNSVNVPMNARAQRFVATVHAHYAKQGRHDLPWRKTTDPYQIAVSEIMLQQTQVDRVIDKYKVFLKAFPTVRRLAQATLADVLKLWIGLGYNRRAKFLYKMAQVVTYDHKGKFPTEYADLKQLPGIGSYTAGAIYAFAYNKPFAIIETNIRTVYLHHFFAKKENVSDAELLLIIEKTLDKTNPRTWYWALMDYGSFLKKSGNSIHRSSKHYAKQSAFAGSRRHVRGMILRALLVKPQSANGLRTIVQKDTQYLTDVLHELEQEGFIAKHKSRYIIGRS